MNILYYKKHFFPIQLAAGVTNIIPYVYLSNFNEQLLTYITTFIDKYY